MIDEQRLRTIALLVAAALSSSACAGNDTGQSTADEAQQFDSATVAAFPNADRLPQLSYAQEARVGNANDPKTGFTTVAAVDVDPDGNLYVSESGSRELRIHNSAGSFVRRIGRAGNGPGEFLTAPGRIGVKGDTIWTVDRGKITLFRKSGELISEGLARGIQVPLRPPEDMLGIVGPAGMRSDGLFWSEIDGFVWPGQPCVRDGIRQICNQQSTAGTTPPADSIRIPRVLFDPSGTVVDTVGFEPPPEGRASPETEWQNIGGKKYATPSPPDDAAISIALADGRIAVSRKAARAPDGAFFTVKRYSLTGDTLYSLAFTYTPVPFKPEELDALAWQQVRVPDAAIPLRNGVGALPPAPSDSMAVFAAVRRAMKFPRFLMPVERAKAGKDGQLWLARETMHGDSTRWAVISPDGHATGTISLKRNSRLMLMNKDQFWTTERDENDVLWIVRYRIRPAAPAGHPS